MKCCWGYLDALSLTLQILLTCLETDVDLLLCLIRQNESHLLEKREKILINWMEIKDLSLTDFFSISNVSIIRLIKRAFLWKRKYFTNATLQPFF